MSPENYSIMPLDAVGDRAHVESPQAKLLGTPTLEEIERERDDEAAELRDADWKPRHRNYFDLSGCCEAGPDNT